MSRSNPEPGARTGPGLFAFLSSVLTAALLHSVDAAAFDLRREGGPATVRVDRSALQHNGPGLTGAAEQSFSHGTVARDLTDFAQPLDIGVAAGSLGFLGADVSEDRFARVTLDGAERNACLDENDFAVSVAIAGNQSSLIPAAQPGGGALEVRQSRARFMGSNGGQCPRFLRYGIDLSLALDLASAAGDYVADVEVTVRRLTDGTTESIRLPVTIELPSLMLLYHPARIVIDLRSSAVAALLGAARACAGDYCTSPGRRRLQVNALNIPVDVGIDNLPLADLNAQTITLTNVVGVRAAGCAAGVYQSATYQVTATTAGIQAASGVLDGIQGRSCTLDGSTGDVDLVLDLQSLASDSRASATISVTITGL